MEKTFELFQRDNFRCFYCGFGGSRIRDRIQLCLDHIKPESKGGPSDNANLITSCVRCNLLKASIDFAVGDKEGARAYLQTLFALLDDFASLKYHRVTPGRYERYPIESGGMRSYDSEIKADPKFRRRLTRAIETYEKYSGVDLSIAGNNVLLLRRRNNA